MSELIGRSAHLRTRSHDQLVPENLRGGIENRPRFFLDITAHWLVGNSRTMSRLPNLGWSSY